MGATEPKDLISERGGDLSKNTQSVAKQFEPRAPVGSLPAPPFLCSINECNVWVLIICLDVLRPLS